MQIIIGKAKIDADYHWKSKNCFQMTLLLVVLLVRSSYTVIDILCLDCIVSCDDEKEIGQKFVDKWIKKGGFDANIKAKILTMSQTDDPVCVDGFSLVYIQKSALQSHGSKANADEKEIIVMDITEYGASQMVFMGA
eukprot:1169185_1